MNLALTIIFYIGLTVTAIGLLLLIILACFKKKLKGTLIVILIGLLLAAAPVGGHFYLTQKAQQTAERHLAKKEQRFNHHEQQLIKHLKKSTVATEYVAKKYSTVWQTLITGGSVVIGDGSYGDYEAALAAEGQILLSKGKLDIADDQYINAQSDYQKMKQNVTTKNKTELTLAKKALEKTNHFTTVVTRPTGTYQNYTDRMFKANQRHIKAIEKLKYTYTKTK
ncbi:hypothetical protein [Latilactobacillus fuchuensis]|uniref:Uncharacterized protein n=1 Tax=Latilactobacillus fuchuensis TaxID=164393 RepID=A0A2N9DUG7_9LACO|nr:hypothetical protein [Latilactobacillus fuchuensis]SPC37718.1 conserved hypothetical protein [Latilactobacillus fuchuensis]